MTEIRRRDVLKGMGAVAVAGAAMVSGPRPGGAQRRFDGETLRVQFWAGPEGQTIRSHVVEPFIQKTGAKVVVTEGWTSASIAKIRAEKGNPSATVYLMDDIGVVTTGREGLLDPLDLSRLPNAVDIDPRFFIEGKGIGFYTYTSAIAYNTNLVKTPPTSWQVLWEPQYQSKVAILPVGGGPILHLAIVAAILNGGSQYNMEPAWEALRALKPNITVMEQNAAVVAELIRNNEVALVMRTPYVFKPYIEKGYPIAIAHNLKEGIFATPGCAAIVKNHPDKREIADAFINDALGADAQTRMAQAQWFGPTNRKVKVPPDVARNLVSTQAQWDSIIPVNLDNLAARREEWVQKITRALL